ncbi:MAG: Rne/Rng family ribonuclease [Bacteroidales bacterium]|nr:Rne/Rng family ribonuclease [Bacteroidales bacterium]
MNKELIINAASSEVNIALLEEKRLVELHKEKGKSSFGVGDVYLGKIKRIMPGLNAAFVDVGHEKDAFLHYLDLGPQVRSLKKFSSGIISGKIKSFELSSFKLEEDINKSGKITEVLTSGQDILVQIAKEPISTKGPRVTSEISFAGRFLVLVPFSNRISISQKIRSSAERNRLKRLITSIKPPNFGVIIRTVAEHKKVADLDNDLNNLVKKWENTFKKLKSVSSPSRVATELDRTSAMLRDLLNESFNSIIVDNNALFEDIKTFIRSIAPDKIDIVKLYKGKAHIFDMYGVDRQIKNSFGKIVTIKSGIYLILEHTEAMHVIDVNSGHRVNKEQSQEENALTVNIEAAVEVARQLRLRDIGGIIVIDFIDMHQAANRRKLFTKLKEEMAKDRAKHTILPPGKFGLVQITRQRVRPEMNVVTVEKCPACNGTGEIRSNTLFMEEIENNIKYLTQEQNEKSLTLAVNPIIYSFLTKGIYSVRMKWFIKFKRWVKLKHIKTYHLLEYRFFSKNNEEIKI